MARPKTSGGISGGLRSSGGPRQNPSKAGYRRANTCGGIGGGCTHSAQAELRIKPPSSARTVGIGRGK